jgi:hypothetical protein
MGLLKLPTDCLVLIGAHLDGRGLLALRRTSRVLYFLAKTPTLQIKMDDWIKRPFRRLLARCPAWARPHIRYEAHKPYAYLARIAAKHNYVTVDSCSDRSPEIDYADCTEMEDFFAYLHSMEEDFDDWVVESLQDGDDVWKTHAEIKPKLLDVYLQTSRKEMYNYRADGSDSENGFTFVNANKAPEFCVLLLTGLDADEFFRQLVLEQKIDLFDYF